MKIRLSARFYLGAALLFFPGHSAWPAALSPASPRVRAVVPFKAEPFPLTDVRLLDGPFKKAMERNAKYLLALAPERLLRSGCGTKK